MVWKLLATATIIATPVTLSDPSTDKANELRKQNGKLTYLTRDAS